MENYNGSACYDYLSTRELVRALPYLVIVSRPDIAHATRHLGNVISNYNHEHYAQAKRVLRYLKPSCDYGLVMDVQTHDGVRIWSYSDADYVNDPVDR
ncbi:polyprotein [Phytophthora megakarya]|uniref:Polyprotein n=1 Tax=Phytophthora megakarya TaxID=4795 RepID=A0A225W9R7_9STRA|nr:polyprotein [Phytophthora megakarya]